MHSLELERKCWATGWKALLALCAIFGCIRHTLCEKRPATYHLLKAERIPSLAINFVERWQRSFVYSLLLFPDDVDALPSDNSWCAQICRPVHQHIFSILFVVAAIMSDWAPKSIVRILCVRYQFDTSFTRLFAWTRRILVVCQPNLVDLRG